MRAKDIFIKARELIAEEQHWTRQMLRADDRYCLLGACCAAAGFIDVVEDVANSYFGADPSDVAESTFGPLLKPCISKLHPDRIVGDISGDAFNFNDNPETTHADVLAVLDCAIECTPEALIILEPNIPEVEPYDG